MLQSQSLRVVFLNKDYAKQSCRNTGFFNWPPSPCLAAPPYPERKKEGARKKGTG